jgi:hypothetical protein
LEKKSGKPYLCILMSKYRIDLKKLAADKEACERIARAALYTDVDSIRSYVSEYCGKPCVLIEAILNLDTPEETVDDIWIQENGDAETNAAPVHNQLAIVDILKDYLIQDPFDFKEWLLEQGYEKHEDADDFKRNEGRNDWSFFSVKATPTHYTRGRGIPGKGTFTLTAVVQLETPQTRPDAEKLFEFLGLKRKGNDS